MKKASKSQDIELFAQTDYRSYLRARLQEMGRGARSRLAAFVPVHTAYITQILSGSSHISLEQAERCNVFLSHSEDEARYFLILVSKDRAGSQSLKKHFEKELSAIRSAHAELKTRLSFEKSLNIEEQLRYYESWMPAAVHIALTIPQLRSTEALATHFRVTHERVTKTLQILVGLGLAERKGSLYLPLSKTLHAGRGSPTLKQHHSNWRLRSIERLDQEREEELHYTSVVSLSKADVPRVREKLIQVIEEVRGIVGPSPEEDLYCYTLDLFRVE